MNVDSEDSEIYYIVEDMKTSLDDHQADLFACLLLSTQLPASKN